VRAAIGDPVATYRYVDERGELLHEVLRFAPKTFRQRRADGRWGLDGVRRVPYGLPAIVDARENRRTVVVVEGEKDADALIAAGFIATTNCGGAGWKWTPEFAAHFAGAPRVVILPDADAPGRKAAHERAEILARVCEDVRILDLAPDETKGYDVSDWLAAGNSVDELRERMKAAPRFVPGEATAPETKAEPDLLARIQSAAAVAGTPAETILWDVERLLPSDDAPMLLFGAPGSLKSWLALHLCDAIVTGRRFLGEFAVRRRPRALFINLDAGPKSFRNRIRRMSDSAAFDFISMSAGEFTPSVLHKLMGHYQGGFVVIDCWAAIYNPDKNDDAGFAMRKFVDTLRAIYAEFDAGGLVIDHPHRPKEKGEAGDYYGNIQKEAGLRTMWAIATAAAEPGQPRSTKISCRKLSEGEPFAIVSAAIDFSSERIVFATENTDPAQRPSTIESRIIEWAGLRTDAFSKRTVTDSIRGYRVADVRAAVENLIERGRIVATGAKRGGGDLYRLECVPQCVPDRCVPIENLYGTHSSGDTPTASASGASECVPEPDAPYETGQTVFD
jgi:hypothetical protein